MSKPEIIPAPSAGEVARREFGAEQIETRVETSSTAVATQARAIVEASYIMAMRRPRDMDQVRVKLLRACERPLFAQAARYLRPVGNEKNEQTGRWEPKIAEGLSIRFAEEAARNMGNLDCDAYSIYDDPRKKIVKFVTTDLETNTRWSKSITIEKTTERRSLKKDQVALYQRINSYGEPIFIIEATPEEIQKREGAEASKAWRDQILKLLAADIREECLMKVRQIATDKAAKDPETEKKAVMDAFASIGVDPVHLKDYLGHELSTLVAAELVSLRGIYTAIKEGTTTWNEVMDDRREADAAEGKPAAANGNSKPGNGAKPGKVDLGTVAAEARAKREGTAEEKSTAEPSAVPVAAKNPDGHKASTLGQRKDINDLAGKARIDVREDVCGWYQKDRTDKLTQDEADDAITRLKATLASVHAAEEKAAREPGGDDE